MRVQLKKSQVIRGADGSTLTYHGDQTFELEEEWARELILAGDAADDAGVLKVCGAPGKDGRKCALLNDHPAGQHLDANGALEAEPLDVTPVVHTSAKAEG